MNIPRRISAIVGSLVLAMTLLMAGGGFIVVRENLNALALSSQETLLWSSLQTELELHRFNVSLADLTSADNGSRRSTPKEVNQRFDILWSRVGVMEQGGIGERVAQYEGGAEIISDLRTALRDVETDVTMITPGDVAAVTRIRDRLDPFADRLRDLSRRILHGEAAKRAGLRSDLSDSSSFLFFMSAFVAVAAILLLFLFRRDSVRFHALAQTNERLLMESRQTEHLKSQFMTMMSHELRTPMNGVLGLMSLLGQTQLNDRQAELVTQASRSGRRMNDLLQDLMDFSELGAGRPPVAKLFTAGDLVNALYSDGRALSDVATMNIQVRPGWRGPVLGDVRLIRQAVGHLLQYLADRAGVDHLDVAVDWRSGWLVIDILPAGADPSRQWQPEFLTGEHGGKDRFASDSIGPAVARQILSQIGGSLRAHEALGSVGVQLRLPTPAPAKSVDVALLSVSGSLRALALAAVQDAMGDDAGLVDPDCASIVLWDISGGEFSGQITDFLAKRPDALVIGLGSGPVPDGFDHWIDISADPAALRMLLMDYRVPNSARILA